MFQHFSMKFPLLDQILQLLEVNMSLILKINFLTHKGISYVIPCLLSK